jgi:hypothetical protein
VVTLDGTASTDADGDALDCHWRQIAGPAVVLDAQAPCRPTFRAPADRAGLVFEMDVDDGSATSAPDTVTVAVLDRLPVADAGPDQRVAPGAVVALQGSGTDADGDALGYAWTQLDGPEVGLNGESAPLATFRAPDRRARLVFALTVDDGTVAGAPAYVVVDVGNTAPEADAGADRFVDGGSLVTLDGTDSLDADGDALHYHWTQIDGTPVDLRGADTATPTFRAPLPRQTLLFRLEIDDGVAFGIVDAVAIHVANHRPVADAGAAQAVRPGARVTLDASASSDLDGDALTYEWVQIGGDAVTLDGADTATPTFTAPDAPQDLTFRVRALDADVAGEWAEVTITVE